MDVYDSKWTYRKTLLLFEEVEVVGKHQIDKRVVAVFFGLNDEGGEENEPVGHSAVGMGHDHHGERSVPMPKA